MSSGTAVPAARLRVSKLGKCYGAVVALAPTDLDVRQGDMLYFAVGAADGPSAYTIDIACEKQ